MKPEVATRRIKTFGERFGEAHLYLAYHAAFPLALTPDLLYRMWANFQRDINGEALNIPWMAVADLLLSSLCDEVGHELYEMDTVVRNALLKELKGNSRFGDKRINELSDFLLAYVQQQLDSHDPDMRDFAQVQRWMALAYVQPNEVAREIASALSKLKLEEKAEWVRMASVVKTFAEPLAEFQPLLIYSRGMANFARNNQKAAATEFSKLSRQGQQVKVVNMDLSIPPEFANDEYDVFISHAAEDKEEFVRPLAEELQKRGYSVWYDEFSLSWGDNLSSSIDKGISQSKFGIIVLSRNFFKKTWTKRELETFVSKEVTSGKVILPIWHQVSREDVLAFSPTLADKLALKSSQGIDYIISELVKILTPNSATPPVPPPKLQTFQFDVVEVDASGQEVKRDRNEAEYFTEDLGNGISLEMVRIPDGKFMMGTEDEEIERLVQKMNNHFRREKPQHEVTVKSFFMGKYSVTQAQWKRVAALPKVNRNLSADPFYFKGDNRPVENVSWNDAVEFCDRLSKHTNKQYRLPSEAEWEYACRAGTNTPFHFGETIKTELANYKEGFTYAAETIEVGSFSPNRFGLYDMHGNVWEWCQDTWHESYEESPSDGSPWTNNDEKLHLLRGGSWFTIPEECRSAFRNANFSGLPYDQYCGFRVVCAAVRTL
ncbi:hypothetical protein NIES4073_79720 [Kalymmatonema gypsitolerans NIES-4073]|nr:hypothetical protein NIES4073_79720 [Scytonema sp. NIES-4073]